MCHDAPAPTGAPTLSPSPARVRGNIETPSLYMWFTTFDGGFYNRGATIASLLVIGVALLTGPYIRYSMRRERR